MSEPSGLPSLISSLRAQGYAEFALLRPDSLADIAMTRQLDQARRTVIEAARHTVAEATCQTVAEATRELAVAESAPVEVRPERARTTDFVVVADLEADDAAVEVEEEIVEEPEEPATAGSPRDGRRSRTLLANIQFLDE